MRNCPNQTTPLTIVRSLYCMTTSRAIPMFTKPYGIFLPDGVMTSRASSHVSLRLMFVNPEGEECPVHRPLNARVVVHFFTTYTFTLDSTCIRSCEATLQSESLSLHCPFWQLVWFFQACSCPHFLQMILKSIGGTPSYSIIRKHTWSGVFCKLHMYVQCPSIVECLNILLYSKEFVNS